MGAEVEDPGAGVAPESSIPFKFLPDLEARPPAPRGVAAPRYALEAYELAGSRRGPGALVELELQVRPGEVMVLLGPAGAGKTAALRTIAGLDEAARGRVRFDGMDLAKVPTERRGFGMVFETDALFPHLDVRGNVAYGPRARRLGRAAVHRRVGEALGAVDLLGFGRHPVAALNTEQRARVALARALSIRPKLLLVDDLFSRLDRADRRVLTRLVGEVVRDREATGLVATRDPEVAMAIADRIAVVSDGTLRQTGCPQELYEHPAELAVATALGPSNLMSGRVVEAGQGPGFALELVSGARWPLDPEGGRALEPGEFVAAVVRPEGLAFTSAEGSEVLEGEVLRRSFLGGATEYVVRAEGQPVITVLGAPDGPAVGDSARLVPKPGARVHVFAGQEEPA